MTKLFKTLGIIFLLMTVVSACSKNDEFRAEDYDGYYWVEGEKISIQKMDNKFYVVFYSVDEEVFRNELSKSGIIFDNVSEWYEFDSHPFYNNTGSGAKKFTNYKIATIESSYEKAAVALSHTLYWAPYYKVGKGDAGLTEMFYVKLKAGIHLAQLEELAKTYYVEILGVNEYNHEWYYLACTNLSKGNSLQMANLFHESGLFEESAPGFYGKIEY